MCVYSSKLLFTTLIGFNWRQTKWQITPTSVDLNVKSAHARSVSAGAIDATHISRNGWVLLTFGPFFLFFFFTIGLSHFILWLIILSLHPLRLIVWIDDTFLVFVVAWCRYETVHWSNVFCSFNWASHRCSAIHIQVRENDQTRTMLSTIVGKFDLLVVWLWCQLLHATFVIASNRLAVHSRALR